MAKQQHGPQFRSLPQPPLSKLSKGGRGGSNFIFGGFIFLFFILPSTYAETTAPQKPLTVYTILYPLEEFTNAIGGTAVRVVNPMPPDEDPASWIPNRKQILEFQKADLIILNGAHFEKGLAKAFLPYSRTVDTCRFLRGNEIVLKDQVQHKHSKQTEHKHSGMDGHTWVDPLTAQRQCAEILKALIRKRPEFKSTFEKNFGKLTIQFQELDKRIQNAIKEQKNKRLLASHPAYHYLARRYDLSIRTCHIAPNATLEQAQLSKLPQTSTGTRRAMLWESTPTPTLTKHLGSKCGITCLIFSPVETRTAKEKAQNKTYFSTMKDNIAVLKTAFETSSPSIIIPINKKPSAPTPDD